MTTHNPIQPDIPSGKKIRHEQYEINLIDLWLILVRQKKLIITTFLATLLVGIAITFIQPKKYNYRTSIEIGTQVIDDKVYPIEDIKILLSKIKEIYLPQILEEYNTAHPEEHKHWEITTSNPNNTQIVIVEGVGIEKEGSFYLSLLQSLIKKIKEVQQHEIITTLKRKFEAELRRFSYRIEEQQDQEKLLIVKKNQIKEKVILTKKNIAELEQLLTRGEQNSQWIIKEGKNEVKTMMLLMLNNQIMSTRIHLAGLKENLYVTLPYERDALDKEIADLHREQLKLQDRVSRLKTVFNKIQETQVLEPPTQSIAQTTPNKKLIIVLALMIGSMLGVFIALFMNFLADARLAYKAKTENA